MSCLFLLLLTTNENDTSWDGDTFLNRLNSKQGEDIIEGERISSNVRLEWTDSLTVKVE